jgi:hypothetical protein
MSVTAAPVNTCCHRHQKVTLSLLCVCSNIKQVTIMQNSSVLQVSYHSHTVRQQPDDNAHGIAAIRL